MLGNTVERSSGYYAQIEEKKVVSVVVVVEVLSTIVRSVEVEPIVHDVDPEAAG